MQQISLHLNSTKLQSGWPNWRRNWIRSMVISAGWRMSKGCWRRLKKRRRKRRRLPGWRNADSRRQRKDVVWRERAPNYLKRQSRQRSPRRRTRARQPHQPSRRGSPWRRSLRWLPLPLRQPSRLRPPLDFNGYRSTCLVGL